MNLKKIALFATLLISSLASAQIVGTPQKVSMGITETVAQIMARQPGSEIERLPVMHENPLNLAPVTSDPNALPGASWPSTEGGIRPAYSIPQTLGVSFLAAQISESGFIPPDVQMAVGPTQVMTAVNGRIKVFSKTGVVGGLNVSSNTFFSTVRNASTISDPRIRFDRLTNRWYIIAINVTNPNNRCVLAVSSGPTITSSSSFTFFFFTPTLDGGGGTNDSGKFCDYPTLGVDDDALYIGGNMFNGTFNTSLFVVRKSSIMGAGPLVVSSFRTLYTSTNGMFTPQGVDNDTEATNVGFILGTSSTTSGRLVYRTITDPGGTPVLSAGVNITVAGWSAPSPVAVQGSTIPLDGLDNRLMHATLRKEKVTGRQSIVAVHNYRSTNTGTNSGSGDRHSSRWYELNVSASNVVTLRQLGSLFDSAAAPSSYWNGGIAMSGQGHMFLGATHGGPTLFAGIAGVGRTAGDALGTMSDPLQIVNSTTAYNVQTSGTSQRWGDYANAGVDPNDDMTIWAADEYCNATNSWGVRIYQMIAPPPAAVSSLTPDNANQGVTTNVAIVGTSTNGSGFFQTEAAFANHMAVSFSGTGVTVNSITFTDPTHISINITIAAGAATGARTVIITNPDGQSVTGSFTINSTTNPAPILTSISPNVGYTLRSNLVLTVNGSNFVSGSSVRWNGTPLSTSFVNSNQLTATVPAANFTTAGTANVTVFTPAPGGGTSSPQTFTISQTTVNGSVTLNDWNPGPSGVQAVLEIFTGATLVDTRTVTLDGSGGFSYLMDLPAGSYHAFVKASHWLRREVTGLSYSSTGTFSTGSFSLINGDVDGDNEVGLGDFGIMSGAFGTFVGDPGYVAAADLDGDGEVGLSDFGILSQNFGQLGD